MQGGGSNVDVRFDPSLRGEIEVKQNMVTDEQNFRKLVLSVIKKDRRTVGGILSSSTISQ